MVDSAGVENMDWNMEFLDPFSVAEAEQRDNSVNILTSSSTSTRLHDDNTPNSCDPNNNGDDDKFNNVEGCNLLPGSSSSLPENLCIRKLIETDENRREVSAANESQLMSNKDTFSARDNSQAKTSGKIVVLTSYGVGSQKVDDSSVSLEVSSVSARIDNRASDSRSSERSPVDSTASSIPVILSSSMNRGKGGAREQSRKSIDHWTSSASAVTSHCNVGVSVAPPGIRYASKCAVGTFPPPLRMPAPAEPLTVRNSSPYTQFLRPVVSGTCAPGPVYRQPYWQQISPGVPTSLVSAVGSNATAIYPRPTAIPPPVIVPYVGARLPAIPSGGPSFAAVPHAPPFIHPYGMPPGVDIASPPPPIPSSATIPQYNPLQTVDHFHRMPPTIYWPPSADPASGSITVSNNAAWLQVPPPPLSTNAAGLSAVCSDRSWFPTAGVGPSVEHLPAMSATEPLVQCNAGCAGNSVTPVGVGGFPSATFALPTSRYDPRYSSQYQYPKAHGSADVSNRMSAVDKIHTDFLQTPCVHSSWPTYPLVPHNHVTSTTTTNLLNPDSLRTSKEWYSSSSSLPSNSTVPSNTVRDLSTFQRMQQTKNNTLSVVPPMSSCSQASQKQNSISATFVWPSHNQQRTVASQTVAASVSTAKVGTFCNQTRPGSFHASTVLTPLTSVKLRNSQSVRPVASATSHNLSTAALLPSNVSRDVAAKIPELSAALKLRPPVAENQTLGIDASANWDSLLLASAVSEIASEASSLQPGNVAELLQKIFFAAKMPNVAAGMRLIVQGLTESSNNATGRCGIAANDDVAPPPPPPPPALHSISPSAGSFTVPIPPPLPSLAELTDGGIMEIDGDLMAAGETDRTDVVRRLTRRPTDFMFSFSQNSDQLDNNSDTDDISEPISGSNSRSVSRLSAGGDACSRSSSSTHGSEAGTLLLSPSQNTAVTTTVSDSFAGTPLSESSDKTDRMNRIVDQVRLLLKPFYKRGDIDTQTYKAIMRKAVPKILASRSVTLNSRHIEKFVEAYVMKIIARQQEIDAATTTKSRTKKNK